MSIFSYVYFVPLMTWTLYDDDDDDDKNQQITSYNLLKADILLILYKGVCISYKIFLPSKMKKYYLQEWVNFEIKINKTNFIHYNFT